MMTLFFEKGHIFFCRRGIRERGEDRQEGFFDFLATTTTTAQHSHLFASTNSATGRFVNTEVAFEQTLADLFLFTRGNVDTTIFAKDALALSFFCTDWLVNTDGRKLLGANFLFCANRLGKTHIFVTKTGGSGKVSLEQKSCTVGFFLLFSFDCSQCRVDSVENQSIAVTVLKSMNQLFDLFRLQGFFDADVMQHTETIDCIDGRAVEPMSHPTPLAMNWK